MKTHWFIIPSLVTCLALLFVSAVTVQGKEIQFQPRLDPSLDYDMADETAQKIEVSMINHLDSMISQEHKVYLPIIQRKTPPCFFAPTLDSPTNGSVLDTLIPLINYIQNNNPISYTIVTISDDPAFDSPSEYYLYGKRVGPKTIHLYYNLEVATKYYWRAQDMCGSVYSPYSPIYTFTTGSSGVILPAPTLISPMNDATGVGEAVNATWSIVPGAVGYQVWHGPLSSGSYLDFCSTNSIVFSYLQPNTTYNWYVNAYNDYAYGNQSAVWEFTTGSFTLSLEDVTNNLLRVPHTLYYQTEQPVYIIEQPR